MQWDAGPFKSRCPEPVRNSRAHTSNTNCRPGSWDAAAAAHHVYTRAAQRNQTTVMEPSESMMLQRLFTKKLEAENFHRAEHDLIWIFTQGIRAEHPPCPSSGTIPVRKKTKTKKTRIAASVSSLQCAASWTGCTPPHPGQTPPPQPEQLVSGLPCANVQDQVRVDHSHSLGRAPGGGKKHGNMGT